MGLMHESPMKTALMMKVSALQSSTSLFSIISRVIQQIGVTALWLSDCVVTWLPAISLLA